MCRRNSNKCVLLGSDPSTWSRFEPLPAPRTLVDSFPHFESAVRAAADGDITRARVELSQVESGSMRDWFIEHAQVAGGCRFAALGRPRLPPCDLEIDKLKYPTDAVVTSIVEADAYRCRYCQRPVIEKQVLKLFQEVVGGSAFPMGKTNLGMHGAVLGYRAVVDHVVPRARGGPTDRTNLVTACYPCNYGKAHYTLEQLRLCAPRPVAGDTWDGFRGLIPALKQQARRAR